MGTALLLDAVKICIVFAARVDVASVAATVARVFCGCFLVGGLLLLFCNGRHMVWADALVLWLHGPRNFSGVSTMAL